MFFNNKLATRDTWDWSVVRNIRDDNVLANIMKISHSRINVGFITVYWFIVKNFGLNPNIFSRGSN